MYALQPPPLLGCGVDKHGELMGKWEVDAGSETTEEARRGKKESPARENIHGSEAT